MAFDKNVPAGNTKVSIGDDGIRDNNAAIETALDQEHDFTTGSGQTGRHHFDIDTAGNRDIASPVFIDGGIHFTTGIRTNAVLQYYSSGWLDADVNQPTIVRRDENNQFESGQFSDIDIITQTAGNVAIDLEAAPHKQVTIGENATIVNPTGVVASHVTSFRLIIVQDGTGGWTVSWGNEYKSASGAVQVSTAANSVTLCDVSQYGDALFLVTSIVDISQAIT